MVRHTFIHIRGVLLSIGVWKLISQNMRLHQIHYHAHNVIHIIWQSFESGKQYIEINKKNKKNRGTRSKQRMKKKIIAKALNIFVANPKWLNWTSVIACISTCLYCAIDAEIAVHIMLHIHVGMCDSEPFEIHVILCVASEQLDKQA